MMRKLAASALASAALAGCATATTGDCGGAGAAAQRMRDVIAADNARDLARVLTYYTTDVMWLPPMPRQSMNGAAAIRSSYETMYATYIPALTITVETTQMVDGGARVTGRTGGRLHPQAGGADTIVNDEFLARLRCERGEWRIQMMEWEPASPV